MISLNAAYQIGSAHSQYNHAWLEYHHFLGQVPDEIAIHLKSVEVNTGSVEILIGVKSRHHKPIGTWWTLDSIPSEHVSTYIEEVRAYNNEEARYPFVVGDDT